MDYDVDYVGKMVDYDVDCIGLMLKMDESLIQKHGP